MRILLQEVCLGGDPRQQEWQSRESEQKRKSVKGWIGPVAAIAKGLQLHQDLWKVFRMPPRIAHPKGGRLGLWCADFCHPVMESCLSFPELSGYAGLQIPGFSEHSDQKNRGARAWPWGEALWAHKGGHEELPASAAAEIRGAPEGCGVKHQKHQLKGIGPRPRLIDSRTWSFRLQLPVNKD